MRLKVFLFTILILVTQNTQAEDKTYAERLGWNKGDRVVILHVDDAGMSHASNRGAIEALEEGLATSVSVMMPCGWVPEFAAYLKKNPETCAGLHLTMNSEWDAYRWGPVAGKLAVPGLTDPMGCLWDKNQDVNSNATPDEVETEIRAQIDRAHSMGIQPTHMDSHMGTLFYNPAFFERYMKVGIELQIPILMAKRFDEAAAEKVWDAGLPVLDHVHSDSYDWKTTEKAPFYIEALKNLEPGITEIIIHSTKPDDVIPVITGNRDHLYGDLFAMVDPEVKKVIEEEGIILTNWRELAERRKNAE